MILDERLPNGLSAVGTLVGATGTRPLSDQIDLGVSGRTLADLWVGFNVLQTAASGGAATAKFELVTSNDPSLLTGVVSLAATGLIPLASITAGSKLSALQLPPVACRRYLGVLLTVGTAAFTAGRVAVFFTNDVAAWKAHAAARTF